MERDRIRGFRRGVGTGAAADDAGNKPAPQHAAKNVDRMMPAEPDTGVSHKRDEQRKGNIHDFLAEEKGQRQDGSHDFRGVAGVISVVGLVNV